MSAEQENSQNTANAKTVLKCDILDVIVTNDIRKMQEVLKTKLKLCVNKPLKVRTEQFVGAMSPLCLTIMEGDQTDSTLVDLLLQHGANPHKRRDWRVPCVLPILTEYLSPVFMAIRKQNIPVLKLLLEAGASVNETSPGMKVQEEEGGSMVYRETHETCLHYAVHLQNVEMVDLLIKKDADVNSLNRDGMTPLHCCGDRYNKDVFELLLQGGAMAHNLDREYQTVLSYLLKPQLYDDGVEIWEDDEILERIESIYMLLSAGYNLQKDVHVKSVVQETLFDPNVNGVCQNPEFMSFIQHKLHNPPSLDSLCCMAIRTNLAERNCLSVADSLPIPQKFKDYILLNSYWNN